MLRATDEVVISTRTMPGLKGLALARVRKPDANMDEMYTRWGLTSAAKDRLRERRQQKFLRLSRQAARDRRPFFTKMAVATWDWLTKPWVSFKYDFYRKHQRRIRTFVEEIDNEWEVFKGRLLSPWRKLTRKLPSTKVENSKVKELTATAEAAEAELQAAGGGRIA